MYDIEELANIEEQLVGLMLKTILLDGYGNIIMVFQEYCGADLKMFRIKNNYYTGLSLLRAPSSYIENEKE